MAIEVDVNDNGTIDIQYGGTNASTAAEARANLGIGTAGQLDAGNAVGEVVVVQAGNKLPALDGSDLTNLPASAISGVSSVNGESGVVVLDADDISDGVNYAIITKTEQANIANNTLQISRVEGLDQKLSDAEAAADAASQSAINAAASESAAGLSESNAVILASDASDSKDAANLYAIQTANDSIATAADVVQTNQDVIDCGAYSVSSGNNAASASISANDAAARAADALVSEQNAAQSAIDAANSEQSISGHLTDTNNPHSVTKAQVGLGNVDNTSDLDKPVSNEQEVYNSIMTEAEFNALAAANRDKFSGSGFVEWGKHHIGFTSINEGLAVFDSQSWATNRVVLGVSDPSKTGVSKTDYPIVNINGITQNISGVNATLPAARLDDIDIPPAPIATNLVTNGTFDTDTSGWGNSSADLIVSSGILRVTNNTDSLWGNANQTIAVEPGNKYRVSVEYKGSSDNSAELYIDNTFEKSFSTNSEVYSFDYTATDTDLVINLTNADGTVGNWSEWDNVSVIDLGKVERQDLIFLESWHEKISDKDIVYPYGNTQSLLVTDKSTGLETVDGSFTGYGDYSLFGIWQTSGDLIGKGIVWSTMTNINKKKFVSDPDNNVYLSEGGELIQVRYRIRVIEGRGADWNMSDSSPFKTIYPTDFNNFGYGGDSSLNIRARGVKTAVSDFEQSSDYSYFTSATDIAEPIEGDRGLFKAVQYDSGNLSNAPETTAYKGLCFALPIALVSRRNQGAYHPVFNPNGTAQLFLSSGVQDLDPWYTSTTKTVKSTYECFLIESTNTAGVDTPPFTYTNAGKISTGYVGRPDSKYFDAIYEGDVLDLRNSSHKQNLTRTLEREFNKLVAGEIRGWEGENRWRLLGVNDTNSWYKYNDANLFYVIAGTNGISSQSALEDLGFYIGDRLTFYFSDGVWVSGIYEYWTPGGGISMTDFVTNAVIGGWIIDLSWAISNTKNNIESKELLQCDIIGDPANYPQEWVDNGVAVTPLIVGEKGEDYTDYATYTNLSHFKLSKKAKSIELALRSTDHGVNWSILSDGLDSVNNKPTATTSNNSGYLFMVFYLTEASLFETADNAEVLKLGDVWAGNNNEVEKGCLPVSHLINKIPIDSYYGNVPVKYSINGGLLSTMSGARQPNHDATPVSIDSTVAPAVKVIPYITRENGKLYLQTLFKEMKRNTTWGDDGKFNVVDAISTTTDDNGNTILIGQKRLKIPYFVGDGE